jgi:hypothetical protein
MNVEAALSSLPSRARIVEWEATLNFRFYRVPALFKSAA